MKIKVTYVIFAHGRPGAEIVAERGDEGWRSYVFDKDGELHSYVTVYGNTWAEVEKAVTEKIVAASKLLSLWRELERTIPEAREVEI